MPTRMLVFLALTLGVTTLIDVAAQAPNDAADAARLVEVLSIHEGSVIADIGAGSGALTVRIASKANATGRVYSTDVNPQRLSEIRAAALAAGLMNVTVIEGGSSRTNLPDACCDGIFMRDVYHHFAEPEQMNRSLMASLKRGGRLAIVDFAPRSGKTAPPLGRDQGAAHGIMAADLIQELTAAGFVDVREMPWPSAGYFLVVAERPR